MLHKKMAVIAVVMAGAIFASLKAQAAAVITNTGSVAYDNEFTDNMTPVTSATPFVVAYNPVLTVVKTHDVNIKGKQGQTVTYTIKVTYPKVADVLLLCGDDSNAVNTIITDVVPAGLTFVPASIQVSTDNGATFAPGGSFAAGTVTVNLGTLTECTVGATTRVITFQATID